MMDYKAAKVSTPCLSSLQGGSSRRVQVWAKLVLLARFLKGRDCISLLFNGLHLGAIISLGLPNDLFLK